MADMQNIQLNLVVSAENMADEALSGVRSTLEELANLASRIFENVAVAAYAAVNSIEDDFRGLGQVVQESLQGVASHAFEPMAIAGSEAVKSLEDDFMRLKQAIETDMKQAAESVSRSLGGVKPPALGGKGGGGGGHGGLWGIQGQTDTMYAGMAMGAAAVPIIGFVKDAIKAYADFDQSVANVNTMLHYHGAQLDHLKQQLIDLSKVVPQGPKELADGLYSVVGAGVDSAHALDVLKVAAEAAAAGQTSLDTASRALITVMDSYGMKATDVKNISDILFAANQAGALTFNDLANAIGTVAGPAANAGVDFKEVAAATAALTNTGLSAQRATEGLRALIIGIQNPTAKAKEEAKKLGIEWDASALKAHGLAGMIQLAIQATHGNAEELKKLIPNIAAYTAAVDLGGKGSQAFKNALDAVNNSAGATDQAMDAIKHSAEYNLQQFSKSWEDVKMKFAQNVLPAVTMLLGKVKELFDWFGQLSPSTQKLVSYAVLATGAFLSLGSAMFMAMSAVGGLVSGIGWLREAFTSVRTAMTELQIGTRIFPMIGSAIRLAFGPWGLIIAGVITGVTLIITHWNQIAAWVKQNFGVTLPTTMKQWQAVFQTVWNAIRTVVAQVWAYIGPTIISGIKEVQKYWNEVWPRIRELFAEVWTAMKALLTPLLTGIYLTISAVLGYITGAWKNGWNAIKDVFKFVWDLIVGLVKTGWSIISGAFKFWLDVLTGHWNQAWNDVKNMFVNIWNSIIGMLGNLLNDALSFGENFVHMIANGIRGAVGSVESAVSFVAGKIKDYLGFHSPTKEGPARTSDQWAPNFMKMFAGGIEDNRDLVELAVYHVAQAMKSGLSPSSSRGLRAKLYHEEQRLFPQIRPLLATPVAPVIERADPFLEADTKTYDWVSGHTSHHPTTSYYDFVPNHTSHHYNININVDGRSKKTDRELAEHIVSLITRNIKTHR